MPVSTEKLDKPDSSALSDLTKVLATESPSTTADLIDGWLAAGELLFAGRFNGHIVAVLRIKHSSSDAHILDITVRDITRGRSVGTQLLAGVLKHYQGTQRQVICDISAQPQLAGSLARAGFTELAQSGQWAIQLT